MVDARLRLADFLPYRLSIASQAIGQKMGAVCRLHFDLTMPEWRVMSVLGEAGAMTQRELVGSTSLDKVAVNRACKSLTQRGLAERSPNERDGRSHLLSLSKQGKDFHDMVVPMLVNLEGQIFEDLNQAEQRWFRQVLDRLHARLDTVKL